MKDTILNMLQQRLTEVERSAEEYRNSMMAALGAIQELRALKNRIESMQEPSTEAANPGGGLDVNNPISS